MLSEAEFQKLLAAKKAAKVQAPSAVPGAAAPVAQPTQAQPGFFQRMGQQAMDIFTGKPVKEFVTGLQASGASTAGGIASLAEKGVRAVTGNKTTDPTMGQSYQQQAAKTVNTPGALAGKVVGDLTQFIEGGAAVKGVGAAIKGLPVIGGVGQALAGTAGASIPARIAAGVTKSALATGQSTVSSRGELPTTTDLLVGGTIDAATAGASKLLGKAFSRVLGNGEKKLIEHLDQKFIKSDVSSIDAQIKYGAPTPAEALYRAGKVPVGNTQREVVKNAQKLLTQTGQEIDTALSTAKTVPQITKVDDALSTVINSKKDPVTRSSLNSLVDTYWAPIKGRLGENPTWKNMWLEMKELEDTLPDRILNAPTADLAQGTTANNLKIIKKEITSTMRGMIHDGVDGISPNLNAFSALKDLTDTTEGFISKATGKAAASSKGFKLPQSLTNAGFRAADKVISTLKGSPEQQIAKLLKKSKPSVLKKVIQRIIPGLKTIPEKEIPKTLQDILRAASRTYGQN